MASVSKRDRYELVQESNCEVRFKSKVSYDFDSGCWIWTAKDSSDGYGSMKFGGRNGVFIGAHRVSYMLYRGRIPDGQCVLHTCDRPLCVNPEHLWLGTRGDNARDKILKGRKGADTGKNKLDQLDVNAIRALNATGRFTQKDIAVMFNLSKTHVAGIVNGRHWVNSGDFQQVS